MRFPGRDAVQAAAFLIVAVSCTGCGTASSSFSGTVQTEYVSVGSQVGGRVIETDVTAGQVVGRGAVILRLDPTMLRAQYDEAIAQERSAVAALRALRAGSLPAQIEQARGTSHASNAGYAQTLGAAPQRIAAARASVADARANRTLADLTYDRTRALASTGDVSQESLDQARAARDRADANLRSTQAQLAKLVQADVPGETAAARANAVAARGSYAAAIRAERPQIAQARAQVRSAAAAAAHALAELREATVYATVGGVIASFNLHPGDMLSADQPAAVIDTFADPYAYIYASQSDLARIRAAHAIVVRSDAGAGSFSGRVEAFDRNAQFTPQNVETADQRAELVYGVKIRIHDPHHELLDGTTVTVRLQ